MQAIVLLVLGSLGAGLSQSLNQLIAFRALQGLGGAGVYAIPLTVLPEITPVETFGLMSAVSGILLTSAAVLYVRTTRRRGRADPENAEDPLLEVS